MNSLQSPQDNLIRLLKNALKALERMRPLCPDHRDKQRDVPCLACRIEELERKLVAANAELTRIRLANLRASGWRECD